jgi:tetratricopeptide (TPR) repeat protein
MPPLDPSPRNNRRLDSWKEIGAFFGRDERTAKRWETARGLPIHRVPGAGRANVYAYTDELADWLAGANLAAEPEPSTNSGARSIAGGSPENSTDIGAFTAVPSVDAPSVERRFRDRRSLRGPQSTSLLWRYLRELRYAVVVFAVLAIAFVIVGLVRRSSSARDAHADAAASGRSSARRRVEPEAEQLYLKGIYYWNKRTPEGLNQAVDYFTQAVVRDPQYAEAYVGLANSYNLLREYSVMSPNEAYPRAMAAAKRAVALDDSLSGAHSSLAFVEFYWSWDVAGAQREFERALALDPNSVVAHHWHATFLLQLGRFPEAIEEIETAQKLDPNSRSILADKGLILFYAGQRKEGISLLKQLETTEPDFLSPHSYLAFAHLVQGDYPQYLAESRKVATLLHDTQRLGIVATGEKGFARAGSRGMLTAILKEQQRLHRTGQEQAYNVAVTCALLGMKQEAIDDLQSAYLQREPEFLRLRIDPLLSSLHDEPRFREMLAQIGMPPLP